MAANLDNNHVLFVDACWYSSPELFDFFVLWAHKSLWDSEKYEKMPYFNNLENKGDIAHKHENCIFVVV